MQNKYLIKWHVLLAGTDGSPDAKIALVSNPLDRFWSDAIADELPINFGWLDSPDYSDNFVRACERLTQAGRHHLETTGKQEANRICEQVFEKYGIVDENQPITDPEMIQKIVSEATQRLALHALNLPHVETLTPEQIKAMLKPSGPSGPDR